MATTHWDLIGEYLETLSNLSPTEQTQFLAQLATENPALHADVLEWWHLQAAHGNTVENLVSALRPIQVITQTSDLSGQTIGAFKLGTCIGRGGMGEVYKASRTDALEQEAAIKVFRYGIANETLAKRFVREQQILSRLRHPHIASFLDAGHSPDGLAWLAMEYIEDGQPLIQYCNQQQASLPARIRVFLQVCEAVQYAHARLVIHRDLKPNNILVNKDGQAKLLDFGIAKAINDHTSLENEAITRPFQYVLTPEYASPEQFKGEPIHVASDVYSLGVILYELITGKLPREMGKLPIHQIQTALEKALILPSRAAQNTPFQRIDNDLDTIVQKALAIEVSQRYASADALREDLQRWLDQKPILAKPASLAYQVRKFVYRNRMAVSLSALLLIALVGGLSVSLYQWNKAQKANTKTEEMVSFLEGVLASHNLLEQDRVDADSTVTRQLIYRSLRHLDAKPDTSPEVQLRILNLLGQIAINASFLPLADSLMQKSEAVSKRVSEAPLLQADMYLSGARLAYLKAEYKTGLTVAEKGLGLVPRPATSNEKTVHINLLSIKGSLLADQEQYEAAQPVLLEALRLSESLQNRTGDDLAATQYNQLGVLAYYKSDYKTASSYLEKSLALHRKLYPEDSPVITTLLNNLSVLYQNQKDYNKAEKATLEVIARVEKQKGRTNRSYIVAKGNYAAVLHGLGKYAEAAAMLETLIQTSDQYAPDRQGKNYYNLAATYYALGRYEAAISAVQKSLLAYEKQEFDPNHTSILEAHISWGESAWMIHQQDIASQQFNSVIRLSETKQPRPPEWASAKIRLAALALEQNAFSTAQTRLDEAKPALKEADSAFNLAAHEALTQLLQYQQTQAQTARVAFAQAISKMKKENPAQTQGMIARIEALAR